MNKKQLEKHIAQEIESILRIMSNCKQETEQGKADYHYYQGQYHALLDISRHIK